MVPGKRAVAAGRANDRGMQLFGKGEQRLLGMTAAGAAAGNDGRTFRGFEPFNRFADELHPGRVVRGFGECVLHRRDHDRIQQHVLRNFQPDGTLGRGDRFRPCVLDGRGNAGGVLDQALALGDVRGRGLLVIELVQHALAARAEALERNLAGDHHHRNTGGVGFLQPGQRRQGAGSGGEEQDADFARGAGVAVRGEGRVVFHPGRDEVQVSAPHGVEQAQGVLPGNPEHRLGAERLEGFDDEVAAVAHPAHRVVSAAANPAGRRDSWPRAWAA